MENVDIITKGIVMKGIFGLSPSTNEESVSFSYTIMLRI
jgi:hypothetical protein